MYVCKNLMFVGIDVVKYKKHFFKKEKIELVEHCREDILFSDEMLNALGVTEGYIDYFYRPYPETLKKYKVLKNKRDNGLKYCEADLFDCISEIYGITAVIRTLRLWANKNIEEKRPKYGWTELRPDKWATPELQKYMPEYKTFSR